MIIKQTIGNKELWQREKTLFLSGTTIFQF